MARALLIVNPYASRVDGGIVARVAEELRDVDVRETERRGHATELTREAEGEVEAIYVLAGDGGFNEAVNGSTGRTPLAALPGGGANVFARALGLPGEPVEAARRLRSACPRRITVGRVNGRRFAFAAGIGLDAEIVRRVDALGRTRERGRAGNVAFARVAVGVLLRRGFRLDPALEVIGHGHAAFALVANTDPYTYAGPLALHVAPLARFELGLDLVAPRRLRARSVPRYLAYAFRGSGQERAADVVYVHDADELRVVCDRPLPLHADGEDLGDVREAVFEAERDAVTVLQGHNPT